MKEAIFLGVWMCGIKWRQEHTQNNQIRERYLQPVSEGRTPPTNTRKKREKKERFCPFCTVERQARNRRRPKKTEGINLATDRPWNDTLKTDENKDGNIQFTRWSSLVVFFLFFYIIVCTTRITWHSNREREREREKEKERESRAVFAPSSSSRVYLKRERRWWA